MSATLAKLRTLLVLVGQSNPFYQRKFEDLDLRLDALDLSGYSQQVPFTLKSELVEDQRAHPPYGSALSFPLEQYTRCHQTSGSSGAPLRWLDTPESWDGLLANWLRIFQAANVQRADRLFFAFSFGPFLGFWTAFEAALKLGCFCVPGGAMDTQTRLQAMRDHGATVLCCTPTYALRLGEAARSMPVKTATEAIKTIITAGEPGGSIPATRARLQTLWPRARVFDHYGMTEVGPASYECPCQPGVLHMLNSAYLSEVIEAVTLRPVEPGGVGELVLTTLDRAGSPLLRYRTGDVVKPRPPGQCLCGTDDLALEGGILGRTDDMVIVKGVNIYPSAIENLVRAVPGVEEYRVTLANQNSMLELSLEVETSRDIQEPNQVAQLLQTALQSALIMQVPVKAVAPGTLPRFEMKARRWVKEA